MNIEYTHPPPRPPRPPQTVCWGGRARTAGRLRAEGWAARGGGAAARVSQTSQTRMKALGSTIRPGALLLRIIRCARRCAAGCPSADEAEADTEGLGRA